MWLGKGNIKVTKIGHRGPLKTSSQHVQDRTGQDRTGKAVVAEASVRAPRRPRLRQCMDDEDTEMTTI